MITWLSKLLAIQVYRIINIMWGNNSSDIVTSMYSVEKQRLWVWNQRFTFYIPNKLWKRSDFEPTLHFLPSLHVTNNTDLLTSHYNYRSDENSAVI